MAIRRGFPMILILTDSEELLLLIEHRMSVPVAVAWMISYLRNLLWGLDSYSYKMRRVARSSIVQAHMLAARAKWELLHFQF